MERRSDDFEIVAEDGRWAIAVAPDESVVYSYIHEDGTDVVRLSSAKVAAILAGVRMQRMRHIRADVSPNTDRRRQT